jgi:hypothetical protein
MTRNPGESREPVQNDRSDVIELTLVEALYRDVLAAVGGASRLAAIEDFVA